jgi:hypothetical protein
MSKLISLPRVTVVVDARLEDMLVKQFVKLGAKGYTCVDCRGGGEHEVVQDVFAASTRVRIETIVQAPVAEAIMKYLHQPQFDHYALCACVETVQVAAGDKF